MLRSRASPATTNATSPGTEAPRRPLDVSHPRRRHYLLASPVITDSAKSAALCHCQYSRSHRDTTLTSPEEPTIMPTDSADHTHLRRKRSLSAAVAPPSTQDIGECRSIRTGLPHSLTDLAPPNQTREGESVARSSFARLRSWDLWSHTSLPGVIWILATEIVVVTWAVLDVVHARGITTHRWQLVALMAACVGWHLFRTASGEEGRRAAHLEMEHVDHSGIWNVAASLVLPLPTALALTFGIRYHRWWRARRPLGRYLFTTSAHVASVLASHTVAWSNPTLEWMRQPGVQPPGDVLRALAALGAIVPAAAAYFLAQAVIIGVARGLRPPCPVRRGQQPPALAVRLVGGSKDNRELLVLLAAGIGVAFAASLMSSILLPAAAFAAAALTRYVQRVELRELESRRNAHTDSKTKLLNHAGWKLYARAGIELDEATGRPASVLMIDGDGLKKINDEHGHLVGDWILQDLGARISLEVRTETPYNDLAARWGGDEFGVFLSGANEQTARDVAERIRKRVASRPIKVTAAAGGKTIEIDMRVSVGVATIDAPAMKRVPDPLRCLEDGADAALYEAKRAGRNQVVVAPRIDHAPTYGNAARAM